MAELLGALSLLNKALPTGLDGSRLAQWALRDGITYSQLANQVALALAAKNQELMDNWDWLFYITEELFQEYPDGSSVTAMTELTDQDRPFPRKAATIGHMIELHDYGDAIGGTRKYFRDVRSPQINAAIRDIVNRGVWRFEQKLLSRWLVSTETTIGSAGYNVPFVKGGGTVAYTPPAYQGTTFTSSHNHYIGYNASTPKTFADCLNGNALTLAEHGHMPPYTAVVSLSDVATYAALTGWVELVEPVISMVDRGGATSGNQYFATGSRGYMDIGYFHSNNGLIQIKATARLATGYGGVCKSYGRNDARNPLAVRVHPAQGFGMMVVPETVMDDEIPIKQLDVDFEFGVGVGSDRTNGSAFYLVAGGSFSDPTVS